MPRYPRQCLTRLLARRQAGGLSAAVRTGHALDWPQAGRRAVSCCSLRPRVGLAPGRHAGCQLLFAEATRWTGPRQAGGLSAAVRSGHALDWPQACRRAVSCCSLRPRVGLPPAPLPVNAPGIEKRVQGTLVTVSYPHLTPTSLIFYFVG